MARLRRGWGIPHGPDRVAVDPAEQLAVAHDPGQHDEPLLRHRVADPVVAQPALKREHVRGLDVADRHLTETRHQVTVEAGRIDLGRATADGHLDVVDPPALGRLAQRLGPGVDPVVALPLA